MGSARLYRLLRPGQSGIGARVFRAVHHAAVAAGIGIMLADTIDASRFAWADALDAGFWVVCSFFAGEYLVRPIAAPGNPAAPERGRWRVRLDWAASASGICDLVGVPPGVVEIVFSPSFAS